MKILVVHRQREVQNEIRRVLQSSAPYIRCFQSGLDGLLAARLEKYDLIISGTDLPVITGFEMARSIRMSSMNTLIPIVFIADQINGKMQQIGQALGVLSMLMPAEMNYSLPTLVGDTLIKLKYDIESSSPHRQN